jgi:maltose alpha-D-glucosyltransferase/alpha-amylase
MKDGGGVLYDALSNPSFCRLLLESILQSRRIDSEQQGTLIASLTQPYRTISVATETIMDAKVVRGEQSNTSVIFGDKLILKLFRRIDQGINPDLEICRFLTEKTSFTQIAPVVGSIEYSKKRSDPVTLAMLQEFVPNEGDAWEYTLDVLQNYLEEILSAQHEPAYAEQPIGLSLLNLAEEEIPPMVAEVIGPYIESARVLGKRTAEMHVALCSDWSDPNFAPERFTSLYQRSLYQSMRNRAGETFVTLRNKQWEMPEHIQPDVSELVVNEDTLIARFQSILAHKISTMRTRIHGDYHLGQVLFTGNDFVIIDFEGEPARSLAERRMKRSPLTDVAGMIRSFDYAVHTALSRQSEFLGIEREEDHALQALWGRFWYQWICAVFIKEYLQVAEGAPFIPDTHEELFKLLEVYILDKAVYELGYELNNRPNWVHIPVQSILNILKNS